MNGGPFLALLSAVLFGVAPALCKQILGEMSAPLLAGLLYLGSGLSLSGLVLRAPLAAWRELRALSARSRGKLAGAVLTGGVLAPLCLAFGIAHSPAFEVSLLLNLETVATTAIAAFVFQEHVGRTVWGAKFLIVAGAVLVTLEPGAHWGFSPASLFVVAACVLWGIDNNVTRDVEAISPALLAAIKGLVAGSLNLALAALTGFGAVTAWQLGAILLIGGASFGLSLLFFVQALRLIGAARTSTYFATGPFLGMLLSVLLLRERPAPFDWLAGGLMAWGVWSLCREKHEHEHTHAALTHSHRHVHDEHHQHSHVGNEGPEPHEHPHTHSPITHTHPHMPDLHHRHRH